MGVLVKAGLTDLVVSPGSRSTALLLAAQQTAGLQLHLVRDERAAGFFALGMARAERRCALLCTSGTAGGHYLPALMEAKASGLPLLVLTADRPPELQGMAAPQTADQARLFGGHTVHFVDLGMPEADLVALRGLARRAVSALHRSVWPVPGPVHVNVPARKPLEPSSTPDGTPSVLGQHVQDILQERVVQAFAPELQPSPQGLNALLEACGQARRPLIIAGPQPAGAAIGPALGRLAAGLGAPVIAEAGSQAGLGPVEQGVLRLDGYDRIVRIPDALRALRPDLVIQVGPPPTSNALLRALQSWAAPRWILSPHGWADADGSAQGLIVGDVARSLDALSQMVTATQADYLNAWQRAEQLAWSVDGGSWGEGLAVQTTVAALEPGVGLMLGNSLSIRHVETYVRGTSQPARPVLVQRGLNGIDGLLAGACGWAEARGALCLLLGDVSALHDASSLELGAALSVPLPIVVLDNAGGRVFEALPVHDAAPQARASFITSPKVRWPALAEAYGLPFACAESEGELRGAMAAAQARSGATLIQVQVPPSGAREQLKVLQSGLQNMWRDIQ